MTDVDIAWEELFNTILKESDTMCPIKEFHIRKEKPPWFSDELLELSANCDNLFKEARRENDYSKLNLAHELRNQVKTGVIKCRSNYYTKLIEDNQEDPPRFWSSIKKLIPNAKSNTIDVVFDPATDNLCQPSENADIINRYFNGVSHQLDSNIEYSFDPGTRRPLVRELIFENDIPVNIVLEHLNTFKMYKPSRCSKISSKLYLSAFKALGEKLAFIFNLSIRTNKIPKAWKKGVITPIPKKGDARLGNNIRPITLTHICGKLFRKIIAARLIDHCEFNHIHSNQQMGFRKEGSTTGAISKLVTDINYAMNLNYYTLCAFIDYRKAFDCVNFDILIDKLIDVGISHLNIDWFKNYFKDRTQCV